MIHHPTRKNIRLPDYDYRSPGYYYVTVCTQERECSLGEITDGVVGLSPFGKIVQSIWHLLPKHFLNVSLDEMQIMPNHVHAIIVIEEELKVETIDPAPFVGNASLGQIVAYWKYQSTKQINASHNATAPKRWQRNMFEHIIRNERELELIRWYIHNNPLEWSEDIENPRHRLRLKEIEGRNGLAEYLLPNDVAFHSEGAGTAPLPPHISNVPS